MSGLYTRLISGLIFPLHERLKGHDTHRLLGKMEQSQWWSPEKLAELQLQRLRELLVSAGEQVPYYRELFELQGFRPAALEETATPFFPCQLFLLTAKIVRSISSIFGFK